MIATVTGKFVVLKESLCLGWAHSCLSLLLPSAPALHWEEAQVMAVMPLRAWHQVSCDSLRSALERSDLKEMGDERDDSGKSLRAKAVGRRLLILFSRTGCQGKLMMRDWTARSPASDCWRECPWQQKPRLLYSEDLCWARWFPGSVVPPTEGPVRMKDSSWCCRYWLHSESNRD